MIKLQYQVLNLMDEICTVEVTMDMAKGAIHLFDNDGALYPMYDYKIKDFVQNESLPRLAKVLVEKQFVQKNEDELINSFEWYFYTKGKEIKKLKTGIVMNVSIENNDEQFHIHRLRL